MFHNYLKIAFRNLKRHKAYSFINIAGLAVGLACCIMILLWVQDELSYDRFHQNASKLYRLTEELHYTDGSVRHYAISVDSLGIWLQGEYPEIISSTRFFQGGNVLITHGSRHFYEKAVCMVDPAFLTMFTFPLIKGNPTSALSDLNAIVMTEKSAEKYFGEKDPMGEMVSIENEGDFHVTGILKDIPSNSHLRFEFLVPKSRHRRLSIPQSQMMHPFTYLQIDERAHVENVKEKIRDIFPKFGYTPATVRLSLQPLKRIHLFSDFDWDMEGHGDILLVRVFTLIAFFILLIACINFINLTTAKSGYRAREVGIRKTFGSSRFHLIRQFYSESVFLCFFALFAALLLVSSSLPLFNQLTDKQLSISQFFSWQVSGGIFIITLITAFISGSYPALFLSSFQPVSIFKEKRSARKSAASFRRILVILQFTLSVILIIGSITVSRQLGFMRNRQLGFDKEHVLYLDVQNVETSKLRTFKEALAPHPQIVSASLVSEIPTAIDRATDALDWEGKQESENILMRMFRIDYGTLDVFQFKMKEGRFFSREFQTDVTEAYVLNQTAVNIMGMTDPVGKRFNMWGREGRIIGVVEDFHFKSLHERIQPLIMHLFLDWNNYLCVRSAAGGLDETISILKIHWDRIFQDRPYEAHFLDKTYEALYKSDEKIGRFFIYFTIIAVFISCLGLFGLVSFSAEQRTKEIGIRKVLGSSVLGIIILLTKEFIRWFILANIIAWSVAYFVMNRWLQNFAYQIDITIWPFVLAGLGALVIALMTVSYQSIKAALANPVESLRYE
jgi:putative ABC transport system permease protein